MRNREPRLPTDKAVRVFLGEAAFQADLVNVSWNGACLCGIGVLPKDTLVIIQYINLCVRAEVAWSTEQVLGVRFPEPLSLEHYEALTASLAFAVSARDHPAETRASKGP